MEYIEIKVSGALFCLTEKEIRTMLHHKDHDEIYKLGISRGKMLKRSRQREAREQQKRDEFNPTLKPGGTA
jgi:hypothetical protein